jgi:ribosomal protein S16
MEATMTNASNHEHDLEVHIPTLRKLDDLRRLSGKLRDEGIEVLLKHRKDVLRSQDSIFDVALTLRALGVKCNRPLEKRENQQELLATIFELGQDLQNLTLQKIADHDLPTLVAARVLRALVACPGAAFSKTALLCYYWIAREIYSAEGSDWNTGGVGAAPKGSVSAFVTGECVHAMLSFAEAHEKTGEFIEEVGNFKAKKDHLEKLENVLQGRLKKWVEVEKERLNLSFSLMLQRLSRYLVLPIKLPLRKFSSEIKNKFPNLDDFSSSYIEFVTVRKDLDKLDDYTKEFLKEHLKNPIEELKNILQTSKENNIESLEDIIAYRKDERENCGQAWMKSESAHQIAATAVMKAVERVEKVNNDLTKVDNEEIDDKTFLNSLKQDLYKASKEVRKLLRPAMNYLDTVLDRELASISLGSQWDWQPAELAFAATAYGRLRCSPDEWEKEPRFERATYHLSKAVSRCGLIPNKRPYHIESQANLHYSCSNSAALTALALLLRNLTKPEIEPELVGKMLEFYEETRATHVYDDWSFSKEELRKSGKKNDAKLHDSESAALQKYIPILKAYYESSVPKICDCDLSNIDDKKKVIEALWEAWATEFNLILKDKQLSKKKSFINFGTKAIREEPKRKERENKIQTLCNKLQAEDDDAERMRLSRVLLESAYEIILESGARRFSPDKSHDKKALGWCREYSLDPRKTNLTATAHAVFALAEINEMLDGRINSMILEHFTVKDKKNQGLKDNLTLDSLFYPDYGLRLAPEGKSLKGKRPNRIKEKDWPEKEGIGIKRQNSVAISLLQMHAHLSRVSLPDNYKPLCSLVLHGPAGTGKTTLIETLAATCDMPLVEVTPSDLVKRGEEDIEQRARAVFEALSMLTRAVILFDEFDPVLKRRDTGNNKPLTVFSFLTPGMLPKLKNLHDRAEKRSVAYILVTNLIGELDEAAVRQGRFDERLGIYPPDLLSRAGRFMDQIEMYRKENNWKTFESDELPNGIKVLIAPGSEDGEGKLSFYFVKNDLNLKWQPPKCGEPKSIEIANDSTYELLWNKENKIAGRMYVTIDDMKALQSNVQVSDNKSISLIINIKNGDPHWKRIVEVVRITKGKGMTALGKQGWFTRPKNEVQPKTLFGYVWGGEMFDNSESDDELKGIRGEGRTAVTECLQWMWINKWDDELSKDAPLLDNLCNRLKELPTDDFLDDLQNAPQLNYVQSSNWTKNTQNNRTLR